LVFVMPIWYMLCHLMYFIVNVVYLMVNLVCCAKKNLATLDTICVLRVAGASGNQGIGRLTPQDVGSQPNHQPRLWRMIGGL
jgi:hypothetical protein